MAETINVTLGTTTYTVTLTTNLVLALVGDTGPALELQQSGLYLQYRAVGTTTWTNLITLASITGPPGASIELQISGGYIQWRVVGGSWANLVATSALKGDDGTAATIAVGTVTTGAAGSSAIVTNSGSSSAAVFDFTIPKGDKGDAGNAGFIVLTQAQYDLITPVTGIVYIIQG